MKKIKLICCVIFLMSLFALVANAGTYGDLTYEISDNEVTITGCSTSATTVTIPSDIEGYPVTKIGGFAFGSAHVTKIVLPETITSIELGAFDGCLDLEQIEVDENNTHYFSDAQGVLYRKLGNESALIRCPEGTSLTSYTLPENVIHIGDFAFYNCDSLTNVTISDSVTGILHSAFSGCDSLADITIPDSVTSIGGNAFSNCTSLTSVTILNSETSIDYDVFMGCTNLTIYGYTGSTAETYAEDNGIDFVAIDPIKYLGTSLILDGSIGVKMSFEYDSSVLDTDTLSYKVTLKNSDDNSESEETIPLTFDEDGKTVYGTVYLAPKDVDNITIVSDLSAKTVDGNDVSAYEVPNVTVPAYISVIKDYAETNEEYAKALDLVLALENYCDYADKFFDNSVTEVEEIELTEKQKKRIEVFAIYPQVSVATLGALKYYSSSLILNETVTIRHYFDTTGEITLSDYTVEGASALKKARGNNNLVYIDIVDIPAQKLSEYWTAKISYADSSMTVKFSPLNYVGLTYELEDAKLRNLVKAIAEYSYQADLYVSGGDSVIVPDENETEIDVW